MAIGKSASRRDFIKLFALTGAYGMVAQRDWFGTLLAEVQPPAKSSTGIVQLKVSDFPTLANDFGSVRVGTSTVAGDVPRGLFYPLLINRAPGNQFYALNAECTHASCVVRPFNRTGNASQCPCHQSRFGIDGRVIAGPASFPLLSYPVVFDGVNRLTIEIPDFPHEISGTILPAGMGVNPRLRLEFFAFTGMEFEVLFRETMAAPWTAVAFSTTATGATSQTVVSGNDKTVAVFVERPAGTGFYAIAIRVRQV